MIGQRIQQFRKQKGLSLTVLAERADVAKSYLSNVERSIQSNPSIAFIEKIAAALDVSVESIVIEDHQAGELDSGWSMLIQEAMNSGVTKDQFRELLEYQKWKMENQQK